MVFTVCVLCARLSILCTPHETLDENRLYYCVYVYLLVCALFKRGLCIVITIYILSMDTF